MGWAAIDVVGMAQDDVVGMEDNKCGSSVWLIMAISLIKWLVKINTYYQQS